MTEQDFLAWLAGAAPGDRIEYHRGFLARDRMTYDRDPEKRNRLSILSAKVRAIAEQGHVHLAQVRLGPERWSYIAIATGKAT